MPGPEQMALDVLLLENSLKEANPYPTLRFYSWKGSWLSIGRNQHDLPRKWVNLVRQKKLQIVRRPSGGSAVLHCGGLTYSLIWPGAPKKRRLAYSIACEWLIEAFNQLGIPLKFGKETPIAESKNCFARSTAADLIDEHGNKRIGSAQLWKSGNLLQHGEIVLNPPSQLWQDVFEETPPRKIENIISKDHLENLLETVWISKWSEKRPLRIRISQKEKIEISKYSYKYLVSLD